MSVSSTKDFSGARPLSRAVLQQCTVSPQRRPGLVLFVSSGGSEDSAPRHSAP